MKKLNFGESLSKMKTRSFRVGGYSVVAAAILLAIAIAANILIGALPSSMTQFDITSNQLFTISEQTEQVLSGLEDEITVYWIAQAGTEDATVGTLLERYKTLSSKIKVETVDPDVYPAFVQQYTDEDYENNSLVVECGDKSRYVPQSDIYVIDLMAYYYYGETTGDFAGESALTSAIAYVTSEELPKIYTLTGHGEQDLTGDFLNAVENENFETEELSLMSTENIPVDADCIVIYAPQSDITEAEKETLLSWLQTGGSLYVIADLPQQNASRPVLNALMEEYGILLQEGVVLETDTSYYSFSTPYCLMPDIILHDITAPLHGGGYHVVTPIAQPIQIAEELREGLDVSGLLETSDTAFAKAAGYGMTTYEKEEGDLEGPFKIAVAATDSNDDGSTAKVVYVSCTSLLSEDFNAQVGGANQDLFINALAWLCGYEDSITIHSKSLAAEYLTIDTSVSSLLSVLFVGVIPVLYLAVGIVIMIRRKRR